MSEDITEDERKLAKAESEDEIFDALVALLPQNENAKFKKLRDHQDRQFLAQLDLIGCDVNVKMDAVRNYLMSEKMRIRWKVRKLPQVRIDALRENLRAIQRRNFNANRQGEETAEVRGLRTYNDTCHEANNSPTVKIVGTERAIELPEGAIEGEYHHMADGENNVKLGWHPEWERLLKEVGFDA